MAAWKAVVEAQCEQFVSLEWGMRIAVAEERLPVFKALAKITSDLPPDQRDQRILAVWKEKLMADCPEADQLAAAVPDGGRAAGSAQAAAGERRRPRRRRHRAMGRQALPGELSAAAAAGRGDCRRPRATWPQRMATDRVGQRRRGKRRRRSCRRAGCMRAGRPGEFGLRAGEGMPSPAEEPEEASDGSDRAPNNAAESNPDRETASGPENPPGGENPPPGESAPATPAPPPGLSEQFDARAVRTQAERFAPYQAVLQQWLRSEVLPLEKLGLAPPAEQPALSPVEEPEGHIRATWKWPETALSRNSAFWPSAPRNPRPATTPSSLPPIGARVSAPHNGRPTAPGRLIPVEKGWEGSSVAVWAVVDLGFQKLFSPPLILGQIPGLLDLGRSRWKWPRLFARRSEPEVPT